MDNENHRRNSVSKKYFAPLKKLIKLFIKN